MAAPRTGIPVPKTENVEMSRFFDAVVQRLANLDTEIAGISAAGGGAQGTGGDTIINQYTGGGGTLPVLLVPPKPERVQAHCGVGLVIVEFNNPFRYYRNHARALIYRASARDFTQAAQIGQADWLLYVDEDVENETEYFYWVRFENTESVLGPVSESDSCTTAADFDEVYEDLIFDLKSDPNVADFLGAITTPSFINDEIRRIALLLASVTASAASAISADTDSLKSTVIALQAASAGFTPGQAPNRFAAETLAAAAAARDAYEALNAPWLSSYDANPREYIILEY